MNNFQIKTIGKALESMNDAENNRTYRHKLDEWERGFIKSLSKRPCHHDISELENHKLNKIREKL